MHSPIDKVIKDTLQEAQYNARARAQLDFDVGEPTSYLWMNIGEPYNPLAAWAYEPPYSDMHCMFVGDPWPCLYTGDEDGNCSIPECKGGTRCYTKSSELMRQGFARVVK